MSQLPTGWAEASLASFANVQLGRQRSPKNHHGPNMRPYLRAANVTWNGLALEDINEMHFSAAEVGTFRLHPGDILLSEASGSASEVGKPAIWRGEIPDCCFQNTLLRVRSSHVEQRYLLWLFKALALTGRFGAGSRGVGIHHLGARALSEWPIPIAPRPEQERIVAAIEEQFSRLDAGAAALERVRRNLKRMRAGVLGATYNNAAEQFGTIALTRIIGKDALFIDGDWVESKDQDPGGDHRLTQLADVGDGVWRNRSSRFMNAEQFHRLACTELHKGDILVARMPDPLGRACLFPGDTVPCATVVDVAIIRPAQEQADARWLMWMLNAPQVRSQVAALAKGTTRRRISRRNLGTIQIPRLDPQAQRTQVHALENRLDAITRMDEAMAVATIREATLRASILAAAFCGTLVPQDPNDEPASLLLERTATERTSANGHPTVRTRKASTIRRRVRT